MAPEILKNLDKKEDDPITSYIWSLGIITYNLLTGKDTWFQGNNYKEVLKNIEKNKITISKQLCPSLEIITNLLKYSPTERPNLKKIKEFELLKQNPLNFDFLNLKILRTNQKYIILELNEEDPKARI